MLKSLMVLALACLVVVAPLRAAEVLIVADEFPAMQVLADNLKTEEGLTSRIVKQTEMPRDLAPFQAVVVYIHRALNAPAEKAMLAYLNKGGRLVALHHSISSGKRTNENWFATLGVDLPKGDVNAGDQYDASHQRLLDRMLDYLYSREPVQDLNWKRVSL